MIHVSRAITEAITAYCVCKLPYEACGILIGSVRGSETEVHSFLPVRNAADHRRETFRFHPAQWIEALYAIERSNRQIAGIFHSHPEGPPLPSAADLNTEWHGLPSHWIISLANESAPQIRAYRYRKCNGTTEYEPLPIRYTDDISSG